MNLEIALRPANMQDASFLWQLHCATIKPYIANTWGWDEDFQYRYFTEHFSPWGNQIIRFQEKDAGVIAVEETPHGIILSTIELLPQFQGLGIGTQLIQGLLSRAEAQGLPVSLRVLKVNPARQLYLRLGFTVVSETDTHYWMRKEGRPIDYLPATWGTQRCFLIEANAGMQDAVTLVFNENSSIIALNGFSASPAELAAQALRHEVLPPGGVAWREKLYLIRETESRDTLGVLSLYFGYPSPDTIYIGSLFLRPFCQGSGMGRELVEDLERRARQAGFREARVGVGLKNWHALRFWTGCGFGNITKIRGDNEFGELARADVELLKPLIEKDPAPLS